MNNWLTSIKSITEDTQVGLVNLLSSVKIEAENDDKAVLRETSTRVPLDRKMHG